MTLQHVVKRIRRQIGQRALSSETTDADANVVDSASTTFSDENLTQRLNAALFDIASNVKAQHVPQLIAKYASATNATIGALRVLEDRVFREDSGQNMVRSVRRSVSSHGRLESAKREATEAYPVHTHDDADLSVFPSGAAPVEVYAVDPPSSVSWGADQTNHLPVDERFEAAIIYFVAASCFGSMERPKKQDFYESLYQEEIGPYKLTTRHKQAENEREVDTE